MAKKSQTFRKRQRERKLREKAQIKRQRREERREAKKEDQTSTPWSLRVPVEPADLNLPEAESAETEAEAPPEE